MTACMHRSTTIAEACWQTKKGIYLYLSIYILFIFLPGNIHQLHVEFVDTPILSVCELQHQEKNQKRKRQNVENVNDIFLPLVRFRLEERSSSSSAYFLLDSSIHPVSTLQNASSGFPLYYIQYTNNHHHPYIGSTTVLTDYSYIQQYMAECIII